MALPADCCHDHSNCKDTSQVHDGESSLCLRCDPFIPRYTRTYQWQFDDSVQPAIITLPSRASVVSGQRNWPVSLTCLAECLDRQDRFVLVGLHISLDEQ